MAKHPVMFVYRSENLYINTPKNRWTGKANIAVKGSSNFKKISKAPSESNPLTCRNLLLDQKVLSFDLCPSPFYL